MDALNKTYKGIWYGAEKKPMTVKDLLDKVIKSNGRSFWLQKSYEFKGNSLRDVKEVAVLRDEEMRGKLRLDDACVLYLLQSDLPREFFRNLSTEYILRVYGKQDTHAEEHNADVTEDKKEDDTPAEEKRVPLLIGYMFEHGEEDREFWHVEISPEDQKKIHDIFRKYHKSDAGESIRGNLNVYDRNGYESFNI